MIKLAIILLFLLILFILITIRRIVRLLIILIERELYEENGLISPDRDDEWV